MADRIDVLLGAQTGDLRSGMDDATGIVQDGVDKMTTSLGGLQGAFLNWEAIKEGFNVIKDAVSEVIATMTQGAQEIDRLQFTLGISNTAANNLAAGLRIVGVSTEDYLGTAVRLERQLKANESGFNQLGVVTRDSNGQLLNGQQLIESALSALSQYKEGTDRNQAAMTIFGRSVQQVYALHLLNNQVMAEGASVLEKYGLAVDQDGIEKSRQFQQGLNEMGLVVDKVIEKVGEEAVAKFGGFRGAIDAIVPELLKLLPLLVELGADILQIASELPDLIQKFNDWGAPIAHVLNQLAGIGDTKLDTLKVELGAAQQHLEDMQNNIFTIEERLNPWFDKQHAILEDTQKIADLTKQIADQGGGAPTVNPPHAQSSTTGSDNTGDKSFIAPTTAADQVAAWRSMLQQQLEATNNYFADTKTTELAFWESKLALVKAKSTEWFDIQNTIFNLNKQIAIENAQSQLSQDQLAVQEAEKGSQARVAAAQKEADDVAATWGKLGPQYRAAMAVVEAAEKEHTARMAQLDQDAIASEEKFAASKLQIELDHVKAKQALGQISATDELAAEASIQDQLYQAHLTALQEQLAVDGLTYDQKRTLYQQIEELTLQHNQTMSQLADQAAQAQQAEVKAWLDPINSALEQSVNGMIQGTQTWQKAVGNLLDSVLAKFVQFGFQKLTNWIATEIGMTAASTAQATVRAGSDAAAALAAHAATAALNAATLTADSALAFAGVFANLAPTLGPLAAGPAAAAQAEVLAQLPLVSAAGGYVVPSDQVMQVHKDEVVLPADISSLFINAAPGASARGPTTIIIQTMDAAGVKDFAEKHGRTFADAVVDHLTDNPSRRTKF